MGVWRILHCGYYHSNGGPKLAASKLRVFFVFPFQKSLSQIILSPKFAYVQKKLYLCTRKGVSGIPDIDQVRVYDRTFAWQSHAWVSALIREGGIADII